MNPTNRYGGVCLFLLLLAYGSPVQAESFPGSEEIGFIKGFTWGWFGSRGEYASPRAAESMEQLAEMGTEWVCIAFAANMKTYHDPLFVWGDDDGATVTDEEIRHAIDLARENRLKVILKPVVNCSDGTWRAWIRFFRPVTDKERADGVTGEFDPWGGEPQMREAVVTDLDQWDQWWNTYSAFLLHYAQVAQEKDVELFCLGCEMSSTEQYEKQWRGLIGQVRKTYDGVLTYNINHGRERELTWLDAVDVIGISAYYEVPPPTGVTEAEAIKTTTPQSEIEARLEKVKTELAAVSRKWNKPILFIETGVTSVRGCARYPWAYIGANLGSPLDQQEQANYYRALFQVFWDEPWFMGYAWWDWPAHLYKRESAARKRGFCVYGKEAETVVREWYAKPK